MNALHLCRHCGQPEKRGGNPDNCCCEARCQECLRTYRADNKARMELLRPVISRTTTRCQYCGKPAKRWSNAEGSCCRDYHNHCQRLDYQRDKDKISRRRYATCRQAARPWSADMIERFNRAPEGSDGWKRLRNLMTTNHERTVTE
jgi:hypothetical protein